MRLLFLLALYGSVNHEVGEVNVAFSLFCLQHTNRQKKVYVKTNGWCKTTSFTMTPNIELQQATSSICPHHVMVTYSRSDWGHGASKSSTSFKNACIRVCRVIRNNVTFRKHSETARRFLQWQTGRETAMAEKSMTHLQPPMLHAVSVTQQVLKKTKAVSRVRDFFVFCSGLLK